MGECEKCGRLACACPAYLDLNYVCKDDLRKLVERWRYSVENPGSVRVSNVSDCADELEAVLNKEGE